MNLRDFKKDLDYFVSQFIDDCSLFATLNPTKESEKVASLIDEAVELYNDLKDKGNAKVDVKKRGYYNQLRKEMFEKLDSLYEQLSCTVKK